jgi:PilZ domain
MEACPMKERWGDKRIQEENRVVIEISPLDGKDEGLEINAFTKDISPSGARILTDRLLPEGSTLNLTFYLSQSRQLVRTPGTVKWGKQREDGLYEVGVQFHHGIPGVLMALISHLYGKEEAIPTEVLKGKPE